MLCSAGGTGTFCWHLGAWWAREGRLCVMQGCFCLERGLSGHAGRLNRFWLSKFCHTGRQEAGGRVPAVSGTPEQAAGEGRFEFRVLGHGASGPGDS